MCEGGGGGANAPLRRPFQGRDAGKTGDTATGKLKTVNAITNLSPPVFVWAATESPPKTVKSPTLNNGTVICNVNHGIKKVKKKIKKLTRNLPSEYAPA
jgi:hypothetical protein